MFRHPVLAATARRESRVRLGLLALEARDVPALYLVSLAAGESGAGAKGDAGAEHTGSFSASSTPVEAATPAEAVSLALSGSLTVTLPWSPADTQTYMARDKGVSQVGTSKSQHLPFYLLDNGGDNFELQAEDLARISYSDWDYNDHYWNLTVRDTVTLTPVVDDTTTLIDDYSLVGTPVNVGYLVENGGTQVNRTVRFAIVSGAGDIVSQTDVPVTTDAQGKGYVFTQVTPTAVSQIIVSALLITPNSDPIKEPNMKALSAQPFEGIKITVGSEGSAIDAVTKEATTDGHIRNVNTPAAMADRIPLLKLTKAWVFVDGKLPDNAKVGLQITGQSASNGTASFSFNGVEFDSTKVLPVSFNPSPGTAQVYLKGLTQTAPGQLGMLSNAGQLVFEVSDAAKPGKLSVKSSGFSVAAIPIGVEISKVDASYNSAVQKLDAPMGDGSNYMTRFGQRYKIRVISDSPNNPDGTSSLDKVKILEVVGDPVKKGAPAPDSPEGAEAGKSFFDAVPGILDAQQSPVAATDLTLGDDIAARFGVVVAADANDTQTQTEAKASVKGSRLFLNQVGRSLGGTVTFDQYFTFNDSRTGATSIVMANSGFTHLLEVPYPGVVPGGVYTRAVMNVTKKPADVTIGTVKVTAGKATGEAEAVVTLIVVAPQ